MEWGEVTCRRRVWFLHIYDILYEVSSTLLSNGFAEGSKIERHPPQATPDSLNIMYTSAIP